MLGLEFMSKNITSADNRADYHLIWYGSKIFSFESFYHIKEGLKLLKSIKFLSAMNYLWMNKQDREFQQS